MHDDICVAIHTKRSVSGMLTKAFQRRRGDKTDTKGGC